MPLLVLAMSTAVQPEQGVRTMCGCCNPSSKDREKTEPKVKEQEKSEKKEPVLTR